jgi:hypothetical protein
MDAEAQVVVEGFDGQSIALRLRSHANQFAPRQGTQHHNVLEFIPENTATDLDRRRHGLHIRNDFSLEL